MFCRLLWLTGRLAHQRAANFSSEVIHSQNTSQFVDTFGGASGPLRLTHLKVADDALIYKWVTNK